LAGATKTEKKEGVAKKHLSEKKIRLIRGERVHHSESFLFSLQMVLGGSREEEGGKRM